MSNALVDLTELELDYLLMLQGLLPPGPAWDKSFVTYAPDGSILVPQSNMTSLLSGLAKEFARLHTRVQNLVDEANPLKTYETIYKKYEEAGLPDNCVMATSDSVESMRIDILHRWITVGGASMAFISSLLTAAGYEFELTENMPLTMGKPINAALGAEAWAYYLNVVITGVNQTWFRANTSSAGDYLHEWESNSVFCYINKIKPAHVGINYTFA